MGIINNAEPLHESILDDTEFAEKHGRRCFMFDAANLFYNYISQSVVKFPFIFR